MAKNSRNKIDKQPTPLNGVVSRTMSRTRGKDTTPEKSARKIIYGLGYRGYRLNYSKVPGKPDICFTRSKIAIFVHGCFWHRCPKCSLDLPKHNRLFWRQKFEANVERDKRKARLLRKEGWAVMTIWECDFSSRKVGAVEFRIQKFLAGRLATRSHSKPRSIGYALEISQ